MEQELGYQRIVRINEKTADDSMMEMKLAEDNFDIILAKAKVVATSTVLAHFIGGEEMIAPLEQLIGDLKTTFKFIRLEALSRYPQLNLRGKPLPSNGEAFPNMLAQYKCICPLTVFLRSVAQGLTRLHVRSGDDAWRSIGPLRTLLVSLEERLVSSRKTWPGLAKCIMFHEEHSQFTVTSSTAKYSCLLGMRDLAAEVRNRHMDSMKAKCTPEVISRIAAVDKDSIDLNTHFKKRKGERDEAWIQWQNPFSDQNNKVQVPGLGATFSTGGEYMVACLLDYWRFEMDKPPAAWDAENRFTVLARRSYEAHSCAEWELWVTNISTPRPQKPHFAPMGGMVGARTMYSQHTTQPPPQDRYMASRRTFDH